VESRLRGHAGTVTITARITPDGRVIEARVRETSGHPALDTAALEAIRRWRFEPALRDGVPVFATATLPVTFTLERARRW
jgi:protein TonB